MGVVKKIHRNFTIPTIFLLFLISCGSKNLSNKIASPRMALNTPIEIDFFLNEESQILKYQKLKKIK